MSPSSPAAAVDGSWKLTPLVPSNRKDPQGSLRREIVDSWNPSPSPSPMRTRPRRGARHRWPAAPRGVGRTVPSGSTISALTAHPHGREEDQRPSVSATRQTGSPHGRREDNDARARLHVRRLTPRAGGGRRATRREFAQGRLTPTGVGRTGGAGRRAAGTPAHPHRRGDDSGTPNATRISVGSPPRGWGVQQDRLELADERRLTPTGVGRTARRTAPRIFRRLTHHGRGKDDQSLGDEVGRVGSPHGRGEDSGAV